MKPIRALMWTELKLVFREPVTVFFTVAFPTSMLLLFGSIYGNTPSPVFGGVGTVDASVPAYMALVLATGGIQGVVNSLAAYRERGILRRMSVTPVRPAAVLASAVSGLFVLSVMGAVGLVVVGITLFGLNVPRNPLPHLAAFTLSTLTMYALGFLVGGVVSSVRAAQAAASAIFFPMIFLSGATFPRELFPEGLQTFTRALPLTHVVTVLRQTWTGAPLGGYAGSAAVLAAILVAAVVVSGRTFRWE